MNAQTKMSVKGQVVIPKDVREALDWHGGQEFDIVRGINSVTLKAKSAPRPRITLAEFDALVPRYEGPPIPESEWKDAIDQMFRDEWGKDCK